MIALWIIVKQKKKIDAKYIICLILLHIQKQTGTGNKYKTENKHTFFLNSHFPIAQAFGHLHRATHTESSGGLWILIHSTDGPFTCRNLWNRFLKPSKSFLDT